MRIPVPLPAIRALRRGDAASAATAALSGVASRIAAMWSVAGVDNPYSRRVALLKRTLPAIGVSLLLLIAVWPRLAPIWERMRFAFPAIDLREARELRMLNPRYAGTDRLGRPYLVTAAVGHQVPDRQDLMSLESPRADMKSHGGAQIVLTADTGIYQSQGQLLDLFGNVALAHENGTRFVTTTARLDIGHNAAEGNDPVEGHGPSGDIKSQGFRIYDKGDTIIFTGKSDMLLKGAKVIAANAPKPPSAPPAVAATAARVEAQAKAEAARAVPSAASQHRAPEQGKQAKHPKQDAKAQRPAAGSAGASPAGGKRG
jgi:lipopolysaccharide export system protein LptC